MHNISLSFAHLDAYPRWVMTIVPARCISKIKEIMHRDGQNQRNYASRWAIDIQTKSMLIFLHFCPSRCISKIKEIMHRDGQNQRNYASRWAIDIQVVKT